MNMFIFFILFNLFSTEAIYDFNEIEFIDNYDGDTIKVNLKNVPEIFGKNLSIRLIGIDAPELKTKNTCERDKSIKVKNFVKAQISKAKNLKLKNCIRDKYFRLVCHVLLDDKNDLSKILLEKKFVIPYDGGTKTKVDWCKK